MRLHKIMQGFSVPTTPIVDSVAPNPKLKLLDQIREVMRLRLVDGCELRVERKGGSGMRSPLDMLGTYHVDVNAMCASPAVCASCTTSAITAVG
jgi:hypothetical protein